MYVKIKLELSFAMSEGRGRSLYKAHKRTFFQTNFNFYFGLDLPSSIKLVYIHTVSLLYEKSFAIDTHSFDRVHHTLHTEPL